MKIVSWNVRGINSPNKRAQIKQQINSCGSDIVLLQEMKLSKGNYEHIISKWSYWKSCQFEAQGASRGLLTLWNPKYVQLESISNTSKWKLFRVTHFDLTFLLVNVYAPNSTTRKNMLWEELDLTFEQSGDEKFVFVGDFNAILSQ